MVFFFYSQTLFNFTFFFSCVNQNLLTEFNVRGFSWGQGSTALSDGVLYLFFDATFNLGDCSALSGNCSPTFGLEKNISLYGIGRPSTIFG